jgi:hypothetical protein
MRTNASSEGRAFEWAKANLPALIDAAETVDTIIKTSFNQSEEHRKVVPPRLAGAFLYLARLEGKSAKQHPETFLTQLYSGVQQNGTLVGRPISDIRDLMAPKVPNYGFRLEAIPRFWSLIKTYNAIRTNTTIKNVRLSDKEPLPKFFFES